jgi:hypothetical protein
MEADPRLGKGQAKGAEKGSGIQARTGSLDGLYKFDSN